MSDAWQGWPTLLAPASPTWLSLTTASQAAVEAQLRDPPPASGAVVRVMRGERCATKTGALHEWAAALQFPWYFRDNWDSFEECLRDLAWLPARMHLCVVTDGDRLLAANASDFATFVRILAGAATRHTSDGTNAKEEARAPVLRLIVQCAPEHARHISARFAREGVAAGVLAIPS